MAMRWAYDFIPTAYVDVRAGAGLCDGPHETAAHEALTFAPGAPLSAILAALPPHVARVYVCGPLPGANSRERAAWLYEAIGEAWEYGTLDGESFVFSMRSRESEGGKARRMDIRHISAWFGVGDITPALAREGMQTVRAIIRRNATYRGVQLFTTPGLTGMTLWQVLRTPCDYPPLPEEIQALIGATSGQGRIQLCPRPGQATAPGFYYLDGRFMYAALTQGLGVGLYAHDTTPEYAGYRPGRYRVRFTVPDGWQHLGLFGVQRPNGQGWDYPDTPGATGETWADGSEVMLALRQGWPVEICERVLFATSKETRGQANRTDPLREWTEFLVNAREYVEAASASGELRADVATLARAAFRNMLLHGIGSFAARGRAQTRVIAEGASLPADTLSIPQQRGGKWYAEVAQPLNEWNAARRHPEWAAHIWARARTRLLYHRPQGQVPTGALAVPREDVLGLQTDALYLTADPGWPDTGRNGAFRLKGGIPSPVPMPRDMRALEALKDRATSQESEAR